MYEYPVYCQDIKSEGYDIISLGANSDCQKDHENLYTFDFKKIDKAVTKSIKWLTQKNTNQKMNKNFAIGKKYHDYTILESFLVQKLNLPNKGGNFAQKKTEKN